MALFTYMRKEENLNINKVRVKLKKLDKKTKIKPKKLQRKKENKRRN